MTIELEHQRLASSRQRQIVVEYRGRRLRPQRLDLVVENQVIAELKVVERLHYVHRNQLVSYLHAADMAVGLLFNFNGATIKGSMKRVINQQKAS